MKLGTLRNPGADLARMPMGLDLRAISVAEGVRAALACAVIVLANEWLHWPPLIYMALAANLTCFCDVGGAIRPRIVALLTFSCLGALCWSTFGIIGNFGLLAVVPTACIVIFCNSFARVWGPSALALGNVLTIVVVFALDRPLAADQAMVIAAMFLAGGLWATFLTMAVWRLHPYKPARVAVSEVWRLLAELTKDLRSILRRDARHAADWDAQARAHRRAIRDSIEAARTVVTDLVRMRGSLSQRGSQALGRLETADQLFGALVALSDVLEHGTPAQRKIGEGLLCFLQPTLATVARSILTDDDKGLKRLDRGSATAIGRTADDPAIYQIAETIADRLKIAARLSTPGAQVATGARSIEPPPSWRDMIAAPVLANLSWNSELLRHALRASVMAAPALAVTLNWEGTFSHWLTITVVLTMQPFYATTWQRALERIGGTVLGGLVGAGLAQIARTPLALAGLLFPLSVIGFSVRQVSYGAYVACLTPQLVVLVELLEPGHSSWEIAGMRALFTMLGGAMAVAGCLVLWPSWEPDRLRQALGKSLTAYGFYIDAAFAVFFGEAKPDEIEKARRRAGVANNNLEASLSRALQEPGRGQRARLEPALLAAATLRRLAGSLSALRYDRESMEAADASNLRAWRTWIASAFATLAKGAALPSLRPEQTSIEPLSRIGRMIDLLDGALRRVRTGEGMPPASERAPGRP